MHAAQFADQQGIDGKAKKTFCRIVDKAATSAAAATSATATTQSSKPTLTNVPDDLKIDLVTTSKAVWRKGADKTEEPYSPQETLSNGKVRKLHAYKSKPPYFSYRCANKRPPTSCHRTIKFFCKGNVWRYKDKSENGHNDACMQK